MPCGVPEDLGDSFIEDSPSQFLHSPTKTLTPSWRMRMSVLPSPLKTSPAAPPLNRLFSAYQQLPDLFLTAPVRDRRCPFKGVSQVPHDAKHLFVI
jgi:hypothetical protein